MALTKQETVGKFLALYANPNLNDEARRVIAQFSRQHWDILKDIPEAVAAREAAFREIVEPADPANVDPTRVYEELVWALNHVILAS